MNIEHTILLSSDEQVIHDARKHWFVIFLELTWVIALMLAPLLLFLLIKFFLPIYSQALLTNSAEIIFFYSLWFLFNWVIIFSIITDYILDIVRITNKRIIDIDQKGFFTRNIASIRLEDIQDITIESIGIFATLLKFGNLKIQSAGQQTEFVIKGIRHPERVKKLIIHNHNNVENAPQKVIVTNE